ncbi:hypothetical protein TNCV_2347481 [Trichonephila clavipes]|nr:hypothetical protein TNCV_2347481 [Trichonephila clavipes]
MGTTEEVTPVVEYVFPLINRLKSCQELAIEKMEETKIKCRICSHLSKKCCEDVSIERLVKFHSNKTEFSRCIITKGETWVHHLPPETKKIKTMDCKRRTVSKEGEDRSIYRQGQGIGFLGCAWDNFH